MHDARIFVKASSATRSAAARRVPVSGTIGDVSRGDGKPTKLIRAEDIAHTWSVPQLRLNVPIGVVPNGQEDVVETFAIHTGAVGTAEWPCMVPGGTGSTGWAGAMARPRIDGGNCPRAVLVRRAARQRASAREQEQILLPLSHTRAGMIFPDGGA